MHANVVTCYIYLKCKVKYNNDVISKYTLVISVQGLRWEL